MNHSHQILNSRAIVVFCGFSVAVHTQGVLLAAFVELSSCLTCRRVRILRKLVTGSVSKTDVCVAHVLADLSHLAAVKVNPIGRQPFPASKSCTESVQITVLVSIIDRIDAEHRTPLELFCDHFRGQIAIELALLLLQIPLSLFRREGRIF